MKVEDNVNVSCDIKTGNCTITDLADNQKTFEIVEKNTPSKIKVIYYYDALCGWCYGFSPVMEKLKEEYKDQIEVEVVSGGLFIGNRAGYVNKVAPHIKAGAYKSVESLTGVKFGKIFLDDVFGEGKMILNSLPPTMALCIVKEKFPEKELEFAGTLLHAVYFDGINPVDLKAYEKYVIELGFDVDDFNIKMNSDIYKKKAEQEFKRFGESMYSGMPSLVLVKNNKEVPISNGYMDYNRLKVRLEQLVD